MTAYIVMGIATATVLLLVGWGAYQEYREHKRRPQ
jgi:hypothetical protein